MFSKLRLWVNAMILLFMKNYQDYSRALSPTAYYRTPTSHPQTRLLLRGISGQVTQIKADYSNGTCYLYNT